MMKTGRSFLAHCAFLALASKDIVSGFQISTPTFLPSGPHPSARSEHGVTSSTLPWSVSSPHRSEPTSFLYHGRRSSALNVDGSASGGDKEETVFKSESEKEEAVGNLVEDDEWMGLSMELGELVRTAIIEDLKKNAREFLGKEEYKVGDISKEIDTRVKEEVARFRGKDEYDLGDFVFAMDEMSKQMTEELTGKPYEAGDLSIELDKRIKSAVSDFCGKESYEFGDLTKEVSKRVRDRVEEFTGKPYQFGDISKAVEERRRAWVSEFLGEDAARNYEFGDITKRALSKFTGKDEYQFGDVTKKLLGDMFGPRKRGGQKD